MRHPLATLGVTAAALIAVAACSSAPATSATSGATTGAAAPAAAASPAATVTRAAVLRRYPMPACADPHGYWKAVLARIKAAGDNAGTNSGLFGLLVAEAPLRGVPALENKLDAELKKTT
ncbi:MAG: hypothetical protein ACRDN0_36460 [Trebonia sp.]